MNRVTLRDHRGQVVEVDAFSATEAKNSFGDVLDRAMTEGMIAITRHGKPRVVVLSIEEYEARTPHVEDPLDSLRDEFDALVERMQTRAAKAAGRALFAVPPARLVRAAVPRTRRR